MSFFMHNNAFILIFDLLYVVLVESQFHWFIIILFDWELNHDIENIINIHLRIQRKTKTNNTKIVRNVLKYNLMNYRNRAHNTHTNDSSLSWLGTGTSIKSGWVKLVLWAQISSYSKWCSHVIPHVSVISII